MKKKLSIEERRNFYLIFKEALNNIVKYAGATLVMIHLKEENYSLHLILRDNGKGFDTSQIPPGNGLNNMKRRAKEMNAEIKIKSSPGNGTAIELRLKA
jgi:signal transduction histidine kinase